MQGKTSVAVTAAAAMGRLKTVVAAATPSTARTMYAYRGGTTPSWHKKLDNAMLFELGEGAAALHLEVLNHNLVTDDSIATLKLQLTGTGKRAIQLGKRATYELQPHGTIDLTISHADESGAGAESDTEGFQGDT